MPKKFKIKSIKNQDYKDKDFIGFEKIYPIELYGIVSVKDYTHAIDYLNSNLRREYESSILEYIIFYIICGLIPGLIAFILELIKSTKYKNEFEKDLKYSIEQINKLFLNKRIVVSYEIEKKIFVRKMRVILKFKISDDITAQEIPTLNKTLSPEGKEIIVLATNNNSSLNIQYQRSHTYKLDSADSNFTFIKIFYKKQKDQDFVNFNGFELDYKCELFNYISETEFRNMITDINKETSKIRMNSSIKSFYKASIVLSFFLFGLFLIIPATIIYNNYKIKFFNKLYNVLYTKVKEYSNQFSTRGISLTYQVYSIGFKRYQSSLIDLIIYIPKDIQNSPTLVKLNDTNTSLAIEPMIENGIAPIFMNQELFINNYNINKTSPAPLLPHLNINIP